MAPVKNIPDLPTNVVKKRANKPKLVKPPPKAPSRITMKIANWGGSRPKIIKNVNSLEKIELANEVAHEQLIKKKETPEAPKPKARPQRKRKPTSKVSEESDIDNIPVTPPPKKIKTATKKNNSTAASVKSASKRKSSTHDIELELVPELIKKPGPKSKIMAVQDSSVVTKKTELKAKKKPDIPKIPVKLKRAYKKKETSNRQENETKDTKNDSEVSSFKKTRSRSTVKPVNERLETNVKNTSATNKGKYVNTKEIKNPLKIEVAVKRPKSVSSTNSNLSWTREISTSTSNTTTCVTVSSLEFINANKKVPVVAIENTDLNRLKVLGDIGKRLQENDSSSLMSDSESSESSEDSQSDALTSKPELNLSTSSLTVKSTRSDSSLENSISSLDMNKLHISLEKFCKEVGISLCFDDEYHTFSEIPKKASLEKKMIESCENFKNIIFKKGVTRVESPDINVETTDHEGDSSPFNESSPVEDFVDESCQACDDRPLPVTSSDNFPVNETETAAPARVTTPCQDSPEKIFDRSETYTGDITNYMRFDVDNKSRDDDLLSIFDLGSASISIMGESTAKTPLPSSLNISVQEKPNTTSQERPNSTLHEPYIPQCINQRKERPWMRERYVPSKINEFVHDTTLQRIKPNMIDKQRADSSSIALEKNLNMAIGLDNTKRLPSPAEVSVNFTESQQVNNPRRMFTGYQPVIAIKSAIYRGHCFFYMASQCKNVICRFPHTYIDPILIKTRLAALSENSLIEEYLLLTNFYSLKRNFGLLFIQECKRRESTKLLLEMAIDLCLCGREDNVLIVNVLETTLLHLNNISFDACDEHLSYEFNGGTMCEALLSCAADSQNFAQFKHAFVKLANFMAHIKKPVDIEVVTKILERVCILPAEDMLARGMLCLMNNTDSRIFENAMTNSFEILLSNIDSDVGEAYVLAKMAHFDTQERLSQTASDQGSPQRTSPDTNNLDGMNNIQMPQQTVFRRTLTDAQGVRHVFIPPSNPVPRHRNTVNRRNHFHKRGRYRTAKERADAKSLTNHRNEVNTLLDL